MARRSLYLLCAACAAANKDDISLLQQSISSHGESGSASIDRLLAHASTNELLGMAPELSERMAAAMPQDAMATLRKMGEDAAGEQHRKALSQAWAAFTRRTHQFVNPKPEELLDSAKLALFESGAMTDMRQMATTMANKSRGLDGPTPLDSMLVGFRTSVAPWNNIIHMFNLPLIKASFTLFTNFRGHEGNAARICVGTSVAVDSTYGSHAHSEFGGIYLWMGSAKWDNVPGWSFGSGSGGGHGASLYDAGGDFSWVWTLAKEPDTVCFFYEICMVDGDNFHSSMLQTESQVETEQEWHHYQRKPMVTKKHSSTWVQHNWCGQEWEFSPAGLSGEAPAEEAGGAPGQAAEEWDPESEAV